VYSAAAEPLASRADELRRQPAGVERDQALACSDPVLTPAGKMARAGWCRVVSGRSARAVHTSDAVKHPPAERVRDEHEVCNEADELVGQAEKHGDGSCPLTPHDPRRRRGQSVTPAEGGEAAFEQTLRVLPHTCTITSPDSTTTSSRPAVSVSFRSRPYEPDGSPLRIPSNTPPPAPVHAHAGGSGAIRPGQIGSGSRRFDA
jgi:hypothetical protein